MTKFIELEPGVAVSAQLAEADFAEVARRGFKSVINNRPDGEAVDQIADENAKRAAQAAGLEYRYQPVSNFEITDANPVAGFKALLDSVPRPALFYCRSGTRCTLLWAQASAQRLGTKQVIESAAKGGYDVSVIEDLLSLIALG